jgi:hypothetical protein
MFKNVTKLIIKDIINYESYFAILLMFKLEELYIVNYTNSINLQETEKVNIICVLYEILKRVRVISITNSFLQNLYIYTPQNTKYNFFDKFIGKDDKIGKTISFPSIEKIYINIEENRYRDESYELPLFPNLKELAINPHYYDIDKYSNIIRSVDRLIIKPKNEEFNHSYKIKYTYSHEFNNIRELTIVTTDINSIGIVYMFPHVTVLRLINPHKDRYKLSTYMLKYVMYIRCLDHLQDLHITNIDLSTCITDRLNVKEFLKIKLSKINIIYNENVKFGVNEDEIMTHLLMIT